MNSNRFALLSASFILIATALTQIQPPLAVSAAGQERFAAGTKEMIAESYGKVPLAFEVNQGQAGSDVQFLSRGSGYTMFLKSNEAVLALKKKRDASQKPQAETRGNRRDAWFSAAAKFREKFGFKSAQRISAEAIPVRIQLIGANASATAGALEELPGKSNYFIGNDPAKWRTNVPTYAKVRYGSIYPGIDLVYYGNHRQLEYDFVIAPGADPSAIQLNFEGTQKTSIDGRGELVLETAGEQIRMHRPVVYQELNGERRYVSGDYTLSGDRQVAFRIGRYDKTMPLVIDPVMTYSTYLGSGGDDLAYGIAVDLSGNAYITGETNSADFPAASPLQQANGGGIDVFVAKLSSSGDKLLYSTFLGGSGHDAGFGIAVDGRGNAYIAGTTDSPNFPTRNPIQATYSNPVSNAFVAALNTNGSALVFSTYLGGTTSQHGFGDEGLAITLDSLSNVYVTGFTDSRTFPTTPNAYQRSVGGVNGFVTKLDSTGSTLLYSTYLGGQGVDMSGAIAVDSLGNAYITGITTESAFPTVNAFQNVSGGGTCGTAPNTFTCGDVFVAKFNSTGTALLYSTYLGGSDEDGAYGIVVDSSGSATVTGYTYSANFPLSTSAVQRTYGGNEDVFVTKLTPNGSGLVFSTYLGGAASETGSAVALGSAGNIYVTGRTGSNAFPVLNPLQLRRAGNFDDFLTVLSSAGSLLYSSYVGGSDYDNGHAIAVDNNGNVYLTGATVSVDFPTVNPLQRAYGGGTCGSAPNTYPCYDVFIVKFTDPTLNSVPTLASLSPAVATAGGAAFILTANGSSFVQGSVVRWNGSDRITSFANNNQLTASIPASDLATAGTAQVTVFNPAPGGGLSKALPFTISAAAPPPNAPTVFPGGTVNAASLAAGAPVAAGSIATVFGTKLSSSNPGGVSIQMNGISSRVFDIFPGLLNFQIPWELAGQSQASIVVTVDGVASSPSTVSLVPYAPGIFPIGSTAQGAVLIANDGAGDTLAAPSGSISGRTTRPVHPGEYITIYCTGLGPVTNQPASGLPPSGSPLSSTKTVATVTIGGVPAPTTDYFFAGLASGYVGLYQVSVQIPSGVPTGDAVPLVISIGGVNSNTINIAVQ